MSTHKYIVRCFVPTDEDNPKLYDDVDKAFEEAEWLGEMQPENRYEVELVDEATDE